MPIAFRRWVFPRPLRPTSTSGLYFLPGAAITARAALTATSFDGPDAYPSSGKAADGAGGGAAPPRAVGAAASVSSRGGGRQRRGPAAAPRPRGPWPPPLLLPPGDRDRETPCPPRSGDRAP